MLAEPERSLISERTRAGVEAAQGRGVKFGRKAKLCAAQVDHAKQQLDLGAAVQNVAALLKVSRQTLCRALQQD